MVPNIFSKVSALLKGEIVGVDVSFNSKRKTGWYLRTDNILDFLSWFCSAGFNFCTMFKGCFAFHIYFLHFIFYPLRKRKDKINGKREREHLLFCAIQKRGEKRSVIRNTLKMVVTNFCEVEATNFNNSYIKPSMLFSLLIHTSFILLGWDIKAYGANQNYRAAKLLHYTAFPLTYLQPFRKILSGRAGRSLCPSVFGGSVDPIPTRWGVYSSPHRLQGTILSLEPAWEALWGPTLQWGRASWSIPRSPKSCSKSMLWLSVVTRHNSSSISSHELKLWIVLTFLIFWHHIPSTSLAHEALAWPLPQPRARVTLWAALPFAASP